MNSSAPKKTPRDATEFEREQLRFLLSRDDLASALVDINPSVAWLPWLAETQLLRRDTQLAPWIEKNFAEPNAVRDVAANLHYFNSSTAEILEVRLNKHSEILSPLLLKCWRLIIRHVRNTRRGVFPDDWFDIAPRIKRGDHSFEVIERLSNALRPKLRISKRIAWHEDETRRQLERPTDLMAIDFEIENSLNEEEGLSALPESMSAEVEEKLLRALTDALGSALTEALEAGVESNGGYGISDRDVPSVAKHPQNSYRTGFLPIVRVMAELWTRLAVKNAGVALQIFELWQRSKFRLVRRLALFAAAHPTVPTSAVTEIVTTLPGGEIFVTNSSVEVFRLLILRWLDLTLNQRTRIEKRIAQGPPSDCFRDDADKEGAIDRCRFDLLGELQRRGMKLTRKSQTLLKEIKDRWPQWQLRPPQKAGFHMWHESGSGIIGDPEKLKEVSDNDLVAAAEEADAKAKFFDGDVFRRPAALPIRVPTHPPGILLNF